MSQEGLNKLMKRINSDASFKKQLLENPAEALKNQDVSAAERMALLTNDEDALRRLTGGDTSGYAFVWATPQLSPVSQLPWSRALYWCGNTHGTYAGPC
jgi:hypothetical protein